ncbi:hypothetical protein QBA54_05210 [Streptomyces sp. B21-108]|jgi:hypothetical protein|uniref:hypothetical protein n=1 Tax=Streptomyces sp. B21-108 TaxID=3039419 RepID=UPI002FF10310
MPRYQPKPLSHWYWGYTLRVTAVPAVHRQFLARCQPLDGTLAVPAQRKARREYANRVSNLGQ